MSKRALEECYRHGLAGGAVVEGWLEQGKERESEEKYGRDKKSRVEEELECVARELGLNFGADA